MNFHSSNREQNASISFRIDRDTLAEKRIKSSDIKWIRVAPHKIILASPDSSWLLEDHHNFHFTEPLATHYRHEAESKTVHSY
ncbi:MAG: hypothetical protein AAGF83_26175 [Cyanobacteria bacterium P01_G01_bin.67]